MAESRKDRRFPWRVQDNDLLHSSFFGPLDPGHWSVWDADGHAVAYNLSEDDARLIVASSGMRTALEACSAQLLEAEDAAPARPEPVEAEDVLAVVRDADMARLPGERMGWDALEDKIAALLGSAARTSPLRAQVEAVLALARKRDAKD